MTEPGGRILVVDDDVLILRLIRESLTGLLGCEVETTPNPEYAFELVLRKEYRLIVIDFSMPSLDGATFYSLLRKVFEICPPKGAKLPQFLLLSGHAGQKRAQEFLREPGVRGLIAKPFSIERLVTTISDLLAE